MPLCLFSALSALHIQQEKSKAIYLEMTYILLVLFVVFRL